MKAVTAVCAGAAAAAGGGGGVSSGRVHRQRRDVENEEIQMYISKLKELVPFIPKNRKISKLEVIQCVIDYICDLQYALETHPGVAATVVNGAIGSTAAVTTAAVAPSVRHAPSCSSSSSPRQPLGVLAPNTILPCASPDLVPTVAGHVEKVTPSDSRPVSC